MEELTLIQNSESLVKDKANLSDECLSTVSNVSTEEMNKSISLFDDIIKSTKFSNI